MRRELGYMFVLWLFGVFACSFVCVIVFVFVWFCAGRSGRPYTILLSCAAQMRLLRGYSVATPWLPSVASLRCALFVCLIVCLLLFGVFACLFVCLFVSVVQVCFV